ncbi:hypothetical protein KDA_01190 [Dictyobacter alpinus]|uniref:Haloacid dehalogenase n=1 Tax=Dictyobacter alpinus TaxID=2014873 RepID=A0A402AZX7_9CHLR|nr:HAD family hydrolase [Dictyobacter alpinus]GCE24635.1 hypothetical protein KDA_01190 [Dictyobacter alpinus]
MTIQAVIFDLGGTLIDWPDWDTGANGRWGMSYDYVCAKVPTRSWPERERYVEAMRGAELAHWQRVNRLHSSATPQEVVQEGFQTLDFEVSPQELLVALDGYAQAVSGWAIIFPDTVPTLLSLRKQGYRMGLLSNTWWAAAWHNADLASHGLDSLLDEVVYTSELAYSKPRPEVFQIVCQRLQVEPTQCVMVGDRLIDDVSGALKVGMRGIWKKTPNPWPAPADIQPTATISQLAELLPLLEQWQSSAY